MQPVAPLDAFSDTVGPLYGTEDFAVFLHALVRMQKPRTVVELGTGTGVAALWLADGVRRNGMGHVWTVDDGRSWPEIAPILAERLLPQGWLPEACLASHAAYFHEIARRFELSAHVQLVAATLDTERWTAGAGGDLPTAGIDLLFSDFGHHPLQVMRILGEFLPRMAETSSLFIDSAPTHVGTWLCLEKAVAMLGMQQIPAVMLEGLAEERVAQLRAVVGRSKLTLTPVIEAKDRSQNSTAWLRIEPLDILPYPQVRIRL